MRSTRVYGEIILVRPVSVTIFALLAGSCAAFLAGFLLLGSYTESTTVRGELAPDAGLVQVHVPRSGTVAKVLVQEGDFVRRGDVLFLLLNEQHTSVADDTHAFIAEQIERRASSLQEELENVEHLQQSEIQHLEKKIAGTAAQVDHVDSVIEAQRTRLEAREEVIPRYEDLQANGLISQDQLMQRREEILDLRVSLSLLERERTDLLLQAQDLRDELRSVPIHYRNRALELMRSIAAARQELGLNEAERGALRVAAPQTGRVVAIATETGQAVTPDAPVATIIPEGSKLQARLYVPSSAIAFVDDGDPVLLRYEAYPYRRYGQHVGTVANVEQLVVSLDQGRGTAGEQRAFRVTVELPSQTFTAFRKQLPLYPGMPLEAELLHETRKLSEWIFEPIRTLRADAAP